MELPTRTEKQITNFTGYTCKINDFLLHNLFADDSGVMLRATGENFDELRSVIATYETISGAKLKINKSTIIPVAMDETPPWLHSIGCYMARAGEIIRYLGLPIGWQVTENQQRHYIFGRLQRRLGNWTYRVLSFAGRMIVLKHILKAMPNHIFTCLSLSCDSLHKNEAICRRFLWGKNDEGNDRVPLVAWTDILRPKREGVYAVTSFELQSKGLRLKQFMKLMGN
ncbi:hypothetical protein R1flu_007238 [Riccia fluitans]|uniref:Reverse transcriptase domain-containing protein n=1 Tax=Riccia fluitans TaxID=41844 RepID=A0ABD1YZE6_9MARC